MKLSKLSHAAIISLTAILFGISAAPAVRGATFTVTTTADSGAGSLRQAIADANADNLADTIIFASPLFDTAQTINLTSAELAISQSVTISGPGARLLTVRRAAGNPTNFRVFNISGTLTAGISGMTVSGGNEITGGGILITGGALALNAVTVSGNTSTTGGGIFQNGGTMVILNSTVSDNVSTNLSGGIRVGNGTANIANTTVSGNTAAGAGTSGGINNAGGTINLNNVTVTNNSTIANQPTNAGGVINIFGTMTIRNSLISGNTAAGSTAPDIRGNFTSNGNNLVGNTTGGSGFTTASNDKLNVSATLGLLGNNGGPTDTHALTGLNPAIDAGNNCTTTLTCPANNPPSALTFDERGNGFPRLNGTTIDIGAVESPLGPTAATVSISGRILTARGQGLKNVTVKMTDVNGQVRTVTSSSSGYYQFTNVAAGSTFVLRASAKQYTFGQPAQVVNASEDLDEINFVANNSLPGTDL